MVLETTSLARMGVLSPPLRSGRRGVAPWPTSRPAVAAPIMVDDHHRLEAPWGDAPGISLLATVTTQPVPPEWWRRTRTKPIADTPFLAGGDREPASQRAAIIARETTVRQHDRREEPRPHRVRGKRGRSLFARLCLVVAGALISYIVVDAATGRGRH